MTEAYQQLVVSTEHQHVVLFHGPKCLDGLVAAWVVDRYLSSLGPIDESLKPKFFPVDYGDPEKWPDVPKDSVVWIVDFTFPDLEYNKALLDSNPLVIHLDHHKGAEEMITQIKAHAATLETTHYYTDFSLERSGAGLVWEFVHSGLVAGAKLVSGLEQGDDSWSPEYTKTNPPKLVSRVEDRDLWIFNYPDTKAFAEGLGNAIVDLEFYERLALLNTVVEEETYDAIVREGEIPIQIRLDRCDEQITRTTATFLLRIGDYVDPDRPSQRVKLYTAIPMTRLALPSDASEQTNLMIDRGMGDIVGAYWVDGETQMARVRITTSKADPKAYVYAGLYGGGGHEHTAGFTIPFSDLALGDTSIHSEGDCFVKQTALTHNAL